MTKLLLACFVFPFFMCLVNKKIPYVEINCIYWSRLWAIVSLTDYGLCYWGLSLVTMIFTKLTFLGHIPLI